MGQISTAVDATRVSRVVGYQVEPGDFEPVTPYLPQRIVILGEANTANQSSVVETEEFEFISAKEVGDKFGYGSMLHQIARILRPLSGSRLGGIPTAIIPQLAAGGSTATVIKKSLTVATTVTENATHKLIINGRDNIDGQSYSYSVVKGESDADVRAKIIDAVSNVIGAPVTAAENVNDIDFTTKWTGESSAELNISFDVGDKPAGIVYAEVSKVDGAGEPAIANALTVLGGEAWNTLVINPYGASKFDDLETFNGAPDVSTPSGRYTSTIFKPIMALFGTVLSDKDDVVAITNAAARRSQVTNVHCPAPASKGFTWEAATNMCVTYAPVAQNTPHLDNSNEYYPDMPVPANGAIGDFQDYDARDFMVKKGSSTVNLTNGRYTVQDFVTTYAPDGDPLPKFRFVRDLNLDWNIQFGWRIIMERDIQDKAILPDNNPSRVDNTITPKQVKQLLISYIGEQAANALIADVPFSEDSIEVGINQTNPARIDIFFKYKRTSTAHIASTNAEVDFNFTN